MILSKAKRSLPISLKGFTIVEMLVVLAVLATLVTIVIVAINPAGQLAKSRDTKRKAEIEALANAVHQLVAETGSLPVSITGTAQNISSSAVDLCLTLVPTYISALPQDPLSNNGAKIREGNCSNYDTGYAIYVRPDGHFVVEAPEAEATESITEIR